MPYHDRARLWYCEHAWVGANRRAALLHVHTRAHALQPDHGALPAQQYIHSSAQHCAVLQIGRDL